MGKKFLFPVFLLLFPLLFPSEKIKVITTTSDIEFIVRTIGKGRIDAVSIVPPSLCPGHFELKMKDLIEIQNGRVILFHGWERWMENLKEGPQRIRVEVDGNWMIPDVNLKASEKILNILLKIDPLGEKVFQTNYTAYKKELEDLEKNIEELKKGIGRIKVISSTRQKEFLQWLGMDVVSEFDENEMSVKELKELIKKGKENNVKIVVDNLQRESDYGKRIASEMGAKYIVLTNFPQGSYRDSLMENVKKILNVIK